MAGSPTPYLDKVLALTKPYERVEHGREEHVGGYLRPAPGQPANFSTLEEFHARYLPGDAKKLDALNAEAYRLAGLAVDYNAPGWAKREKAALDARDKYNKAVAAAVARAKARTVLHAR